MSSKGYVIRAERLSKEYYFFKSTWARLAWAFFNASTYAHAFTALNDVNFQVPKGESFGIIGQNGSGKSTLLRILAGISHPTKGSVSIKGTVAALLELGLGFHHELTGYENVMLNSFFSGIQQADLEKKIEFIRDFSELGDFFYRPVRMYSTGMFMRLAFSMAIAVEPEILIVDEALSVGDQKFQKKCIDYIAGLLEKGVTLFFCSHDLYTVEKLCSRVMWLHQGRVKMLGESRKVVSAYQESLKQKARQEAQSFDAPDVIIEDIEIFADGKPVAKAQPIEPFGKVTVNILCRSLSRERRRIHLGIGIYASDETEMFATSTAVEGIEPAGLEPGETRTFQITFPEMLLLDGSYTVTGIVQDETGLHVYHRLIKPDVLRIVLPEFKARGAVYLKHKWNL